MEHVRPLFIFSFPFLHKPEILIPSLLLGTREHGVGICKKEYRIEELGTSTCCSWTSPSCLHPVVVSLENLSWATFAPEFVNGIDTLSGELSRSPESCYIFRTLAFQGAVVIHFSSPENLHQPFAPSFIACYHMKNIEYLCLPLKVNTSPVSRP